MSHIKYTKELLAPIVANSVSIAEVIRKLGLKPAGGTHYHISKRIKKYELDLSHFSGQSWNKGKTFPSKRPIQDYLSNKVSIQSNALKKRLIKDGLLEERCNKCLQTEWLDQPMPLELHHKDCNHHNNNLDNLEILCPNCHACEHVAINALNKLNRDQTKDKRFTYHACSDCDSPCQKTSKRCKSCAGKHRNKDTTKRPTKEQLIEDKSSLRYFAAIGRKYEVSDNAVRKWFKHYSLS